MVIDAHHHFWKYTPEEYGWISDRMAMLRRDFLPADLRVVTAAAGVDGVVTVQARQCIEETRWLLQLADENALIRGVVGWVPLVEAGVGKALETFAAHPRLKAVRHVLQDEPDDNYMLRPDFDRGIGMLRSFALRYDILIFERHLPLAIQLVDRHPQLTFILDHVAKPMIRAGEIAPWRENMRELARRPNVYCKISGMVTEADWESWSEPALLPYMDVALEAFGPRRLMFGSDWPVCLVACDYGRWFRIVSGYVGRLSTQEQAQVMGETAVEAYGL